MVLDAALAHVAFGFVADHHVALDLAVGACAVHVAGILRGDFVAGLVHAVFEPTLAFSGDARWEHDRHRGRREWNNRRGLGGCSRGAFSGNTLPGVRFERRWRRAR